MKLASSVQQSRCFSSSCRFVGNALTIISHLFQFHPHLCLIRHILSPLLSIFPHRWCDSFSSPLPRSPTEAFWNLRSAVSIVSSILFASKCMVWMQGPPSPLSGWVLFSSQVPVTEGLSSVFSHDCSLSVQFCFFAMYFLQWNIPYFCGALNFLLHGGKCCIVRLEISNFPFIFLCFSVICFPPLSHFFLSFWSNFASSYGAFPTHIPFCIMFRFCSIVLNFGLALS